MKRNASPSRPVRQGFTLVELLAVILCVALLLSLALPLYVRASARYDRPTCNAGQPAFANAVCSYGMPSSTAHRQLARLIH
jgi:prepilin-type N-terminal cleavage/methylation domain-containing protein